MARQLKRAVIRLQTVTTLPTEYANDGGHPTIGETIDDLIRHHTAKGQIPNKLVLDLNPPDESNPADIGDTFNTPDWYAPDNVTITTPIDFQRFIGVASFPAGGEDMSYLLGISGAGRYHLLGK